MATVNEKMTAIADKVRTLSGLEDSMSLDDMSNNLNDTCTEVDTQADLIAQITAALENKTSGSSDIDVSGVTATPSDVLAGKVFVDSTGTSQTGNIPTKTSSNLTANGATVSVPSGYYASTASKSVSTATQATPSITVSSSGLITASATQSAGYVSAGTKSGTKQLTTQGAKTITPSTSSQTAVASGVYTTGAVTVKGDANLKAENIKSGVSIFGVTGTASGSEDLDTELTEQENLISQLSGILDSKASGGSSSGGTNIETCTVNISTNKGTFGHSSGAILYTTIENGAVVSKRIDGQMANLSILCVCGSLLVVDEDASRVGHTYEGLVELEDNDSTFFLYFTTRVFQVIAAPNTVATLVIEND